ncbi:MAG TPA: TIGR02996 domain-containing protein, partial [Gemmataceae bacterium]|nr:TIGR02996 domain-containing protein [Gemmataceae bacterium]
MSAEAVALMRAIRDCPEDDLPRLAYADYLAENGDPDRGEFIRIQVDLSRLPDTDPRRRELEDREHELLAENEPHWLDGLASPEREVGGSGLHGWRWERGFVVDVAATPLAMLEHAADLFADHPVRHWRVISSEQDTAMPQDLLEAGR